MTITATKSDYHPVCNGPDWVLYSDVSLRDTAIVWALFQFAKENTQMCYAGMYQLLRSRYARRKEKSDCLILDSESMIEVIRPRGGFPRFYILKNMDKLIVELELTCPKCGNIAEVTSGDCEIPDYAVRATETCPYCVQSGGLGSDMIFYDVNDKQVI